jgi:hypothetical protein
MITPITFDYSLDETVHMNGKPLSLRSALEQMPDPVGPYGVLHREDGKTPPLFDTFQIQALLNWHRSELNRGNKPSHRGADE